MKVVLTNDQIKELALNHGVDEIDVRAKAAFRTPSEKQKQAGNYQMGHVVVHGLPVTIENPVGSKRTWVRADGTTGYTIMQNNYGYFRGTEGKDGDEIDVFIGPIRDGFTKVYVVDQYINGEFDESKVMLGFPSLGVAKKAYLDNYEPGWKGLKYITGVPFDIFKEWLYRGRKQVKDFRDYALIKKNEILAEQRKRKA